MAQQVKIVTLVDITDSGVTKVRDSNLKEYHQQQNLGVLLQLIGMRSQPIDYNVCKLSKKSLNQFGFDPVYQNEVAWEITFYNEAESVWTDGIDQFRYLKDDIHGVAFTPNLDESADILIPVFDTKDKINTIIKEGFIL